jgi:Fe-Mn family superoxide dismutase
MKNNPSNPSRRDFLATTAKAGLTVGLVGTAFSDLLAQPTQAVVGTGFTQTPLPYAYTALEPHIDARTMEIHYSKHAAAYASNLRDAAKEEGVDTAQPLEQALASISKYSAKMRNNGGGHYNHELFWSILGPPATAGTPAAAAGQLAAAGPDGALLKAIKTSFGSYEAFVSQFEAAAKTRFGSGWAWLLVDATGKLVVSSTPNQDNPLMDIAEVKGTPILGLDVWEHAYYLHYQNRRPDYVTAFWKVVNWKAVADRFAAASK